MSLMIEASETDEEVKLVTVIEVVPKNIQRRVEAQELTIVATQRALERLESRNQALEQELADKEKIHKDMIKQKEEENL